MCLVFNPSTSVCRVTRLQTPIKAVVLRNTTAQAAITILVAIMRHTSVVIIRYGDKTIT